MFAATRGGFCAKATPRKGPALSQKAMSCLFGSPPRPHAGKRGRQGGRGSGPVAGTRQDVAGRGGGQQGRARRGLASLTQAEAERRKKKEGLRTPHSTLRTPHSTHQHSTHSTQHTAPLPSAVLQPTGCRVFAFCMLQLQLQLQLMSMLTICNY